jgi:hypothetical protein
MTQLHALAQALDHPAPARGTVGRLRLIGSLVLAPAAFTAQVVCSYGFASSMCQAGARPQAILVAINALAIIAAAAGFILAVSSWRKTRGEKPGSANDAIDIGEGRTRFLALCGLWGSSMFLLAVVLGLTAIVTVGTCPGAATGG